MDSSLLGMIALVTSIVVLASAIVAFMTKLRKDISEIHVLVNKRLDEALNRIDQLGDALTEAEVAIPARTKQL